MLILYARLHWNIFIPFTLPELKSIPEETRQLMIDQTLAVMSHLWILQILFGILAMTFAIAARRNKLPGSIITLLAALASLATLLIIM